MRRLGSACSCWADSGAGRGASHLPLQVSSRKGTSVTSLHCNAQTTSEHVIQRIRQACSLYSTNSGRLYRPRDGDRLVRGPRVQPVPPPPLPHACRYRARVPLCVGRRCVASSIRAAPPGTSSRRPPPLLQVLFLKDINLPRPDKYDTCALIAFLQQLVTFKVRGPHAVASMRARARVCMRSHDHPPPPRLHSRRVCHCVLRVCVCCGCSQAAASV
jgi:hypothetical protein